MTLLSLALLLPPPPYSCIPGPTHPACTPPALTSFFLLFFAIIWMGCVLICWGCQKKILQPGWLNRNVFSHIFGGWKSKIKVSACLLGLQRLTLSLSSNGLSSVCPYSRCHFVCLNVCLCKNTSQVELGPTLITSFSLNHLFL